MFKYLHHHTIFLIFQNFHQKILANFPHQIQQLQILPNHIVQGEYQYYPVFPHFQEFSKIKLLAHKFFLSFVSSNLPSICMDDYYKSFLQAFYQFQRYNLKHNLKHC